VRETQIALDADHVHVCKFENADDDTYEQVIDNLVDLVRRAIQEFQERQQLKTLSTSKVIVIQPNPLITPRSCAT
jgi:hypothetical protein